jgi:pimeloyl-ACP methyl ester carboxylesterase
MSDARKLRTNRWRGLKALVHDAVDLATDLVEVGHESTARSVRAVTDVIEPIREGARWVDDARRVSTRAVLRTIDAVNRTVERATDVIVDEIAPDDSTEHPASIPALPMRSDAVGSRAWVGDAAIGLLNAAVGDHLNLSDNALDMRMLFRVADHYVAPRRRELERLLPDASPRVALFVHGLGTSEWSWCLNAERYHGDPTVTFGTLLEAELDFTPVYLRYNTGRRVADNGRLLARQLQRFIDEYPVEIEDLTIFGHSMGGLVVRSASHYAEEEGLSWPARVRRVFCLGAPHHGAPLAKLSHLVGNVLGAVDLPATQIGARIFEGRSAGIKDMRHGQIVDEDWFVTHPDAATDPGLLRDARHYFLSATVTIDPEHPAGRLIGDLLVRDPSAEGRDLREAHFEIETFRYGGMLHHQLQNHPSLYVEIRGACAQ